MDESIIEDAARLADAGGLSVEQVLSDLINRRSLDALVSGRMIGLSADEPELLDEIARMIPEWRGRPPVQNEVG